MDDMLNGFTGFNRNNDALRFAPGKSSGEGLIPFDEEKLSDIEASERRWAWVEIDRSAIRHNVHEAKRRLRPGVKLMAVVKADAYGHGAYEVSRTALNSGADELAVATVDEGIELRQAGIKAPILLLSQPPVSAIPLLLHYRIMPSIYDAQFALAYGEMADAHHMKAPFHLAVNTGMNRIGVHADEVIEFERQIAFHRALDQVGIFTHFATADCPENLDFQLQVKRFTEAIEALHLAGVSTGTVHAANSAALLRYPETHFDMARLGIALYGFHPCKETRGTVDLHPAMSVYARITDVRSLAVGEGVSYGLNYRSPGSVKICTIPVGYADGYNRLLSGNIDVILEDRYCHQVGNICMDQCMFEVDMRTYGTQKRLNPQVGDLVTLVGAQGNSVVTITEMAYTAHTIEHEIAIGFANRLPRIYR